MITRIYAIHDVKADCYMQTFNCKTDGQATRQFQDTMSQENSLIAKHPQDFTLFLLGTYDDNNGKIEPNTPISLGNGVEFLPQTQITQE